MFPGFITVYRDDSNLVHLYFFKGISDTGSAIYNDLDLSSIKNIKYDTKVNSDGSIDCTFLENLSKISSTLIENKTNKKIDMLFENF